MKSRQALWFVLEIAVIVIGLSALASQSFAAPTTTITVNTTDDELNADGDCSLREAIKAANTDAAVDTCPAGTQKDLIQLPGGTSTQLVYILRNAGSDDTNALGDLDILATTTVQGTGTLVPVIEGDAGWQDRLVHVVSASAKLTRVILRKGNTVSSNKGGAILVNSGSSLTLDTVTVTGNTSAASGGGIANAGSLTLQNNTVIESNLTRTDGGGIYSTGVFSATDTILQSNTADHGDATAVRGGAIYIEGTATLSRTVIQDNHALVTSGSLAPGGGIYINSAAVVTLDTVTLAGNSASQGGGWFNNAGTLTLSNSIISDNTTNSNGGGGYVKNATLHLRNSTLSGNSGNAGGGMYFDNGIVNLSNMTLTANHGTANGGGIFKGTGTVHSKNSIIAANTTSSGAADCFGSFVSDGNNLIGIGCNGFTNNVNGDRVGTAGAPLDSRLGALANNGGATQTHALLFNSPAMDAGNATACTDETGAAFANDQRGAGFARALDGKNSGTARCDIGAYEAPAGSFQTETPTPTSTSTPTATVTPTGQNTATPTLTRTPTAVRLTVVGTVWNDLDFDGVRETAEPLMESVTVQLWQADKSQMHDSTVTGVDGTYRMDGPPGSLTVRVVLPTGFFFAPYQKGSNGALDSDIFPGGTSDGYSFLIAQQSGGIGIDAGMYTGVTPTPTPTTLPPCDSVPVLAKPKNKAVITKLRVNLAWGSVGCGETYKVVVYKKKINGTLVDSASELVEPKYKTHKLKSGKTYAWQVQACNASGCSELSTGRKFTIAP